MLQGHVNTKSGKVYVFGQIGDDTICFVSTDDKITPILGYSVLDVLDILVKAKKDGTI